jgi:RNA-directed DNA polymerase
MAKSSTAQRESEGLVVPMMVATNNATGGKGPCFGHARSEGKREGMAAKSGPNYPDARMCDVQVREPQRELWVWAKSNEPPRAAVIKAVRRDAGVVPSAVEI